MEPWRRLESILWTGILLGPAPFRATNRMVYLSEAAERYDMILPGMQAETKTARPRLRDLGLRDWVTSISEDSNLTVRTSPAGRHGAQLARMLGSRAAFVDLFSGPLLTAMRDMRPTAKSTPAAYPDGYGVRIDQGFGCLTFEGVHVRTRGLTPEQTRDLLDVALDSGVLRRGLALLCGVCEQLDLPAVLALSRRHPQPDALRASRHERAF
jgi:hypothetical protein